MWWLAYLALIVTVASIPAWTYLFAPSRYSGQAPGPEALGTLVPLGVVGLIVPGVVMRHLDTAHGSLSLTVALLLDTGAALTVGLFLDLREIHWTSRVLPAAPLVAGTVFGFLWDMAKRLSEFTGTSVGGVVLLAVLGVVFLVLKAMSEANRY